LLQAIHLVDINKIIKLISLVDFRTSHGTKSDYLVLVRRNMAASMLLPCLRIHEQLVTYKGRLKCTIRVHFQVALVDADMPRWTPILFDPNCNFYSAVFKKLCSDLMHDYVHPERNEQGQEVFRVRNKHAELKQLRAESMEVLEKLEAGRQARILAALQKRRQAITRAGQKRRAQQAALAAQVDSDDEEPELTAEELQMCEEVEATRALLAEYDNQFRQLLP
jgi:hypothetical protein